VLALSAGPREDDAAVLALRLPSGNGTSVPERQETNANLDGARTDPPPSARCDCLPTPQVPAPPDVRFVRCSRSATVGSGWTPPSWQSRSSSPTQCCTRTPT
jgi:hypothetical protein